MEIIEQLESKVRSYSRSWPVTFARSRGHKIWDVDGNEYIDFFTGAGSLNYGHNHPDLKRDLLDYIQQDGITHSLDMATEARERFLTKFNETILKPRDLDYVVQFPGPTGTNAVEAALKLARKYTGRELVVGFTNAFHGMTLGSLSVTSNDSKRSGAGVSLGNAVTMPYEGFLGDDSDTVDYLDAYIQSDSSGVGTPAAVIVETVQGEGGMYAANKEWLRKLEKLCRTHEILLIVDDIQMGCGRTGTFFSFEPSGIKPDIVTLSKSISGYGLPMSLTLFRRELDVWDPGEHNGTFRGHNPAFVTATRALDFWQNDDLTAEVNERTRIVEESLDAIAEKHKNFGAERRGRGLAQGIAFEPEGMAEEITAAVLKEGLIMETSGANGEVAKLLPPLNIPRESLEQGLRILENAVNSVANKRSPVGSTTAAG